MRENFGSGNIFEQLPINGDQSPGRECGDAGDERGCLMRLCRTWVHGWVSRFSSSRNAPGERLFFGYLGKKGKIRSVTFLPHVFLGNEAKGGGVDRITLSGR